MGDTTTKAQEKAKARPRAVTVEGVTVTISPDTLDDWDVMELLEDLQDDPEGNALKVVPLMRRILGDDYTHVKDALRDPATGRLPTGRMAAFLTGLFEQLNPNS